MKAAILLVLFCTTVAHSQCSARHSFSGEEDACLDKAPAPPKQVIEAILKTPEASASFEQMTGEERATIGKLFTAMVIHLHDAHQRDMIVRGSYHMSGADNTWFWIVTNIDTAPKAIFLQGNAVTISKRRSDGYRNFRTDWGAGIHQATNWYRFTKGKYRVYRSDYRDIPD